MYPSRQGAECDQCGKAMQRVFLAEHKRLHCRPKRCDECRQSFTAAEFATHVAVCTARHGHVCGSCGKSYTKKTNLSRHYRLNPAHRP